MADSISFQNLQRWGIKGGLSVLDQGLFSGANFIASILFARWLSPSDYGAFALVYALYLLLTGFYTSFILEPMSVLGPAKYSEQLSNYLLVQLKLHGMMASIFAVLMVLIGIIISLRIASLGHAFIGAGFSIPFMLLLWYVRRMFYVLKQPIRAFWASALYCLLLAIAVTALHSIDLLNSFTCFIVLGATSLLGSLFPMLQSMNQKQVAKILELPWLGSAKEQWLYGRWIAIATILTFSANQIQVILLAAFINLPTAGALDALQNFIAPVSQGIVAISTLVLPIISYDFGQSNIANIRRKIIAVIVVLTLIAGVYEMLLLIFPKQLELLLYRGNYSNFSHLIPILGIIPIFTAVTTGFSLALRAIQKPQFYLVYGIIVAPAGLLTGVLLTYFWGLEGAVLSLLITSLVTLVVHIYLYNIWFISSVRNNEIAYESK